jgi:superfamily II DNA or RNA helicase
MAVFELRPYQTESKDAIRASFMQGKRRVILCKPTGSGKTVTFANIARESVLNGFTVMILVDRKELLEQARDKLISYGLNPSIITAGRTGKTGAKSYIATVQTLVRRKFPPVDLLIIDEAHKQIFDKVLQREDYKNALVIGATATPFRTGRMNQLSDLYDELIEKVSINDLIQAGYLVPAITYGAKVDTSGIKVKRGDYDSDELYSAFNKPTLYAGVVEKYRKFADNTKAICFCINVEHSKKVADSFNAEGIPAVHLDGKTPKAERARILDAFSKGLFKVLCNVEVLTTGFDEWTIETVIVNLATKSLPKWLQMAGRGSRITPREFKGVRGRLQKEHFNLIDMGGNVHSLGFWEQERDFSLTHKTRDEIQPAPVKECPEDKTDELSRSGCGAILHASAPRCKYCGFIFPKVKKEAKEAEFIQLENYELLPPELVGKSWGSMSFEELETVRKIKGFKHGWIIRQILFRNDLELIDYARFKGYKSPAAWVDRMERMYIKTA